MICIRCMNKAAKGHRLCEHCLEEAKKRHKAAASENYRRWYEKRKDKLHKAQLEYYYQNREKILDKMKTDYAEYNKEAAYKHALCTRCGKNPRLYNRTVCAECRNRAVSERHQAYKDGLIQTKPCAICGKNPSLYHKTMCAECRNAQQRQYYKEQKLKKKERIMNTNTTDVKKHAAYTAVCSKILDMAVDNYKKKEGEKLCKICGKAPRLSYSSLCHECYAAVQHSYYEARKKRRACKNTDELCSVCGKAPKLASCSLCRDCLNASRRKLYKERADKGVTQTDTPAPQPKKYRGLCIVCGKNPKLSNMGKCRDCYNAHRRMSYAQLKKDADAAKADQKSVQVQVTDPVRVEVNNVGCGYVAAILFVLWIITVIGLVFR